MEPEPSAAWRVLECETMDQKLAFWFVDYLIYSLIPSQNWLRYSWYLRMSRTTLNSEGSSIPVLSEEAQAALAEFYQVSFFSISFYIFA